MVDDQIVTMSKHIRFMALTCSNLGLQMIWSLLMATVTPFLTSLGFNGASVALVWSISPICGSLLQPFVGVMSDGSQWRRRGRRALLLGGSVATSITLIGFSLSSIQGDWVSQFLDDVTSESARSLAQIFAVIWFILLNIAIQPLQMASRTITIENIDRVDQLAISAWTSRMQGIGSIVGFLLGFVATDITLLSVLASIQLLAATLLSASAVKSTTLTGSSLPEIEDGIFVRLHRGLFDQLTDLHREIWQIFAIQFLAWLGWFPMRTYYTSWLAITSEKGFATRPNLAGHWPVSQLRATRLGSFAGIAMSTIAFVANCALPWITSITDRHFHRNRLTFSNHDSIDTSVGTILGIWLASHVYFAFAMFLAGFVESELGVMLVVSSLGLSWAVTIWVPFCLIGLVLSRQPQAQSEIEKTEGEIGTLQMGAVVGLHNAAISVPQIVAALLCSFIFSSVGNPTAGTLLTLLFGGCCALTAAFAVWLFSADLQHI